MTWSDRFAAFRRGLIRICVVVVVLTSSILAAEKGNTWITMQCLQGDVISLYDTVRFEITVDTRGEYIYGYQIFLTIPEVLTPVLHRTILNGVETEAPFIGGDFINYAPSTNKVHEDVGGLYDSGYQYNYGQFDPYQTYKGTGIVASFDLAVTQIPVDPTGVVAIKYDYIPVDGRFTKYARIPPDGGVRQEALFGQAIPDTVRIAGALIYPPIPDTVLTPGSGLDIWLGQHFTSALLDSTQATWWEDGIYPGRNIPGGSVLTVPVGVNPVTPMTLTTNAADHDILDVLLKMQATDPNPPNDIYYDQQNWKVAVDHPPFFDQPLPDTVAFDEDVPLGLVGNGGFFTDLDDSGADLQVRLEPDTYVHVSYTTTDSIIFSADTNWYGSYPARLFVEDALGISADTLLTFTVNPINDPPVINFDSVSALGDTVVIHRNTPDTLDLNLFASDVDDEVLTWDFTDPYPDTLSVSLLAGNLLRLEAGASSPFIDIDLTITATDDEGASDSDTLVVSIRPWPPDIIVLEDIKINSQDTLPAKGLDLTQWVTDLDTPPAAMTWVFRALDADTYANDDSVTFSPTSGSVTDTVTISVPSNYSTIDILEMTVTDDAGYSDIDTARLFIFDGDAPTIYPLPGLTIYRDTTYAGILDLDDYVADIQDDPAAIDWTFFGGDSLESFSIDSYSHEVTITTNSTFIGNLTISLVAEDNSGLRDTSDLAILVSRRVDGPPLWYAMPAEVEVVYGWTTDLLTFGEVCYDETPTDSIDFISYCDTTLVTVTVGLLDSVKLTTPILIKDSTTYLYFSARDEVDSVSNSGIITVSVKDSFSPVWQQIPTISLRIGETYSGLLLRYYVSDRDTPDSLLTIEVVNDNPYINVSYNSVTSELTVSASVRTGDSWLSVKATDDKDNTATTLVHVVVFAVADNTPPVGGLTYFFNPATDRWVHYVVTADGTTDISRFTWHYSYGAPPRDWSDHLPFVMNDSLPGAVTWTAPYHFQNEGSYVLTVAITDAANNILDPSPTLHLSVGFSKAIGGALASPDQQLTVTYPPALIPNDKLLIISEDYPPDSTGQPTAKIAGTRAKEKAASQAPATVYSLDANLPEPILATLTYRQKRDTDPYYSFYELEGDRLVKIETYTSTDGYFEAAATLNRDIVFAPSDTPARNAPLPNAELFCYPNPFNATIQVRFLLRRPDQGRIVIYNLLGREIYASPRQILEPGVHAFSWHSIDRQGLPAPSGIYFIRLETDGGKIITRKVTLLK